jgi:hypothetical protein
MLLHFIIACAVLVYSAMSTDIVRKFRKSNANGESTLVNYVNVTALVLSAVAVLYTGYHLFAGDSIKSRVNQAFA